MSFEDLRNYLSLANPLIAIGTLVYVWLTSRSATNSADITKLRSDLDRLDRVAAPLIDLRTVEDKVDELGGRVSKLETIIHQLPDKDSMHRLEISLEKVNGQLNTLSERLNPIDNLSRRLQEILLEKTR